MECYETQMKTDLMPLLGLTKMPSTSKPKTPPPNLLPEPIAPRDLVSIHDLAPAEILQLFNLTSMLKQRPADFRSVLRGKQMVMFFEKPSLRTRLTFEAGMDSLGGSTFFVEEMATYAGVPVINALSELEHPCQALADFFTLQEHFGDLKKIHFAYVGDGNNMAHSLLLAGASAGAKVSIATPERYALNPVILTMAQAIAEETGATLRIGTDARKAVKGADAVYTDTWASMGQETEAEERQAIFAPYQVNGGLMALAAPHARFMHCLPAHRGCEVTDQVIDSLNSVVFDQAENRLHIQKAILVWLLGSGVGRYPAGVQGRSAHA